MSGKEGGVKRFRISARLTARLDSCLTPPPLWKNVRNFCRSVRFQHAIFFILFPFNISDLLRCTEEPNVSIPTLANLLLERTQNPNWIVVFKSLVTIHHMMCYGHEVS